MMYAKRRVCRDVTLSLGSNRRIGYLYIFKPSDRATSRQRAARQQAVWRASLATGRHDGSAKRRQEEGDRDINCVVAIGNTTRKVYQISHYNRDRHQNLTSY
jgi:hypothetical protein